MFLTKRFNLVLVLMLFCILLSSCGPSPEELAATAAAETKAAATNTPIPTLTPIPTKIPTLTPIPTSTSTPLPKPDAQAMIRWKDLDLPGGSFSVDPETENIQEGKIAMSLEFGDGSTVDYITAGSFVFIDDMNPSQIIYGYAFPLPTSKHREGFDANTQNYLKSSTSTGFGIPINSISTISGANDIGDLSAGVTATYLSHLFGVPWQISMISFRIDSIGSLVFVRNDVSVKSPVNIKKVARVYASSIQNPISSCQFKNVTPVEGAAWPLYDYQTGGFYPGESLIVVIEGKVQLNNEPILLGYVDGVGDEFAVIRVMEEKVLSKGFGLFGIRKVSVKADKKGQVDGTIMLSAITGDDVVPPKDITLSIFGLYSGCEIEQTVTWHSDLTRTPEYEATPETIDSWGAKLYRDVYPPYGNPLEIWDGIPIMPNAVVGSEAYGGYYYSVEKTLSEVREYYQRELGKTGYYLSAFGEDDTTIKLVFTNGKDQIVISALRMDLEYITPELHGSWVLIEH